MRTRSNGRRRTGEEREGGERAGCIRLRKGFRHSDDRDWWCRGRGLDYLEGYMGCGAERAVGMGGRAVCVVVCDLGGACNNDQKDAEQREEKSPRAVRAPTGVFAAHIKPTIA